MKIPALKKCNRHPFFTYNQWNEIKKQSWGSASLPENVTFIGDFASKQFCTEIFKCGSKRQESYYLLREYKGTKKRHLFRLYGSNVLSPVLGIKDGELEDLYHHISQQILSRKVVPSIRNPYINLWDIQTSIFSAKLIQPFDNRTHSAEIAHFSLPWFCRDWRAFM